MVYCMCNLCGISSAITTCFHFIYYLAPQGFHQLPYLVWLIISPCEMNSCTHPSTGMLLAQINCMDVASYEQSSIATAVLLEQIYVHFQLWPPPQVARANKQDSQFKSYSLPLVQHLMKPLYQCMCIAMECHRNIPTT